MSEAQNTTAICTHGSQEKDFFLVNKKCGCEYNHESEYARFFAKTNTFINENLCDELSFCINQLERIFHHLDFQTRINPHLNPQANGGVFMSYDFHLSEEQPKLIEVNVNAGGIFIAHQLALYAKCCCSDKHPTNLADFEQKIIAMFKNEYALKGRGGALKTMVIIDENPESQFLYPDFQLCKALLKKNGIQTFILDPSKLRVKGNKVFYQEYEIDLIYNRLTDFYFERAEHTHLKKIYDENLAVITPSPQDHSVFAQKSSLALMNDESFISTLINRKDYEKLKNFLLSTYTLQETDNETLWEKRKKLFFKPLGGFGSKGAYHGKGITKKTWETIKNAPYIAQEFAPAGKRSLENQDFKYDLRVYTYQGDILLITARLYQGQTTNFRTEGGGFSAVLVL